MARRPKWLNVEEPAPEHIRKAKSAGRGTSDATHDEGFWHGEDAALYPWIAALEAIDKRDDKTQLLDLLNSDDDFPQAARFYLADLLDRYQLRRKPHGQATPAYTRSEVEKTLLLDIQAVNRLTNKG